MAFSWQLHVFDCVILYHASGEREGFFCPALCFLLTPGGAVPGAAVSPRSSHQHAGVSISRYTNLAENSIILIELKWSTSPVISVLSSWNVYAAQNQVWSWHNSVVNTLVAVMETDIRSPQRQDAGPYGRWRGRGGLPEAASCLGNMCVGVHVVHKRV